VLLSCISACGRCRFCRERRYGLCIGGGGWIFGHKIDGVQAEFARVPFADTSTYQVPEGLTDEQVLYLADILPTAMRSACSTARSNPATPWPSSAPGRSGWPRSWGRLYSPAAIVTIDPTPARRDWAETFGANVVATPEQARAEIDRLTDGLGADVAVEAVGIPATFEQCTELIRPGGRVAKRRGARQAGDAAP
jgi:alcohol dehydrogenase